MKTKMIFRNNLYFLYKSFKIAPLYLIISIVFRIVAGLRTSFMYVYFLPYVISCIESGRNLTHILVFISVSFAIVATTYIAESIFDNIYKPICGEKIEQVLKHTIFDKAHLTDYEMFDTEEYYTSVILADNESSNRVFAVTDNILGFLESFVAVVSIIGYSLSISLIVPLIASVSFIVNLIMDRRIAELRVDYDYELKNVDKERAMLHRILYLPEYAKDVRLSNIRNLILNRYRKANGEADGIICKKGGKVGRCSAWKTVLSSSLCIDFLVPLYLVYQILIRKALMASGFVAVLNGCNQLQLKLESISANIGEFYQNGKLIERYRNVEFRKGTIESIDHLNSNNDLEPFEKIELDNCSFQYCHSNFGLENINLTIYKGEKIAIVGPNGSGKTTLIKLLLRLYDCRKGEIRYNDFPITKINVNTYRQAFSTLFQDFCIYSISLAKNIALDEQVDETKVYKALTCVGMENNISRIRQNMTREIYEDGMSFSGGELQRLALARVLYENHEILIMDEPTSAMDVVFEKRFYDMVLNQLKDKTILFVSHRLSSCVICDRIIYMERGRIAEIGTHRELMELGGGYAKMFNAQERSFG